MEEADWFDIALKHVDDSNFSQALVAITKYVEENPKNDNGILEQAFIYRELHNYKLALQLLEQIVPAEDASDKFKSVYYLEMAETLSGMGRVDESLIWYDKYITFVPDQTLGYILKGACLAASGEYELAKKEHLKATTLTGNPEETFYNLALITRAEMNFAQAKEYCEKSLEIYPGDKSVEHCLNDIIEAMKL